MTAANLSNAYALLRDLAATRGRYSSDQLGELEAGARKGSLDISRAETQFADALDRARGGLDRGDEDELADALIHLRIAAMSIVADFGNFADEIALLFQRKSVRCKTGVDEEP